MLQVVVLRQEVVPAVHLLQYPGVDPLAIVDSILIIVEVTDQLKVGEKTIGLNIGVFQKLFNSDLLKINPKIHFFLIVEKFPMADAVRCEEQIKGGFGMFVCQIGYILADVFKNCPAILL